MGQPTTCHRVVARFEENRVASGTAGTETSQYREERKSNETPGVVASETGRAQTDRRGASRAGGVVGDRRPSERGAQRTAPQRKLVGNSAVAGESPVRDVGRERRDDQPEYHGTREILWEAGGTTLQG